MPFVKREGVQVWYSDQGRGLEVLLIHGGMMEPASGEFFWDKPGVTPELVAARYRVLVPDRRYCGGRTSAPFEHYSWDVDAADFAAVLRGAGVERAHIVAGSNGCSSAIRFALSAPQMVRSLVLCWPAARDESWHQVFEMAAQHIERIGPLAYLDELRAKGFPRPNEVEERPGFPFGMALLRDERAGTTFIEMKPAGAALVIRETARALLAGDLLRGVSLDDAARLGALGFPVFVMPAEPEDPPHPRATAEQVVAAIPGARMLPGFPETPRPDFQPVRAAFVETLSRLFNEM